MKTEESHNTDAKDLFADIPDFSLDDFKSLDESRALEYFNAEAMRYDSQEDWLQAAKNYAGIIKWFPDSLQAQEAIMKLAYIYYEKIGNDDKPFQLYKKLVRNYPDSQFIPQAYFMTGFIYSNDKFNFEKGCRFYREFIKKFPDNDLVESARWELEHIVECHPNR